MADKITSDDLFGITLQPDRRLLATINGINVETVGNSGVFFFKTTFTVDADGSPKAYHRDDSQALDYLKNACGGNDPSLCYNGTNNWTGIVAGADPANPPTNPNGCFVSKTSLEDKSKRAADQSRYVNSSEVPYIVLPNDNRIFTIPKRHTIGTATLGDFALTINPKTLAFCYAIVADVGPGVGEGSIKLAELLGYDRSAKTGGSEPDPIICLVFPDTGKTPPWPVDVPEFEKIGSASFTKWGGTWQLMQLFPELATSIGDFLSKHMTGV